MKLAVALAVLPAAAAFVGPAAAPAETRLRETKADLEALAKELNPTVGFYDPLGLSSQNFWGKSEEETIGFLRHAEIKHGRVAMAAFSGYVVQANGFHWPWAMTMDGRSFDVAGSPPEQWDAIPLNAKLQIVAFVGFLERAAAPAPRRAAPPPPRPPAARDAPAAPAQVLQRDRGHALHEGRRAGQVPQLRRDRLRRRHALCGNQPVCRAHK